MNEFAHIEGQQQLPMPDLARQYSDDELLAAALEFASGLEPLESIVDTPGSEVAVDADNQLILTYEEEPMTFIRGAGPGMALALTGSIAFRTWLDAHNIDPSLVESTAASTAIAVASVGVVGLARWLQSNELFHTNITP